MLKQKTVYFREEDLELWEAVENKAEFLHNALKAEPIVRVMAGEKVRVFAKVNPKYPVCKVHGTPLDSRGKCLQKGCKYA